MAISFEEYWTLKLLGDKNLSSPEYDRRIRNLTQEKTRFRSLKEIELSAFQKSEDTYKGEEK